MKDTKDETQRAASTRSERRPPELPPRPPLASPALKTLLPVSKVSPTHMHNSSPTSPGTGNKGHAPLSKNFSNITSKHANDVEWLTSDEIDARLLAVRRG